MHVKLVDKNGESMYAYESNSIRKIGAEYNIVFGERSNGKTYDILHHALEDYIRDGYQFIYLRRWDTDFIGIRGEQIMANLMCNFFNENSVSILTKGKKDRIVYYSGRWYLGKYDEKHDKIVRDAVPFAFGIALNNMEHDKSTSYPHVRTIIFDEFLSRDRYLTDEWQLFTNVLSTVIRQRDDVTIWLLGNTVNNMCPYFTEMGLKHIKQMKQGTIETYTYNKKIKDDNDKEITLTCKVAVEYTGGGKTSRKKSDKYFLFDSPSLSMITSGAWEFDMYPHCPTKYKSTDIIFTYFIRYDGEIVQCDVIHLPDGDFTYIHKKTTPIRDDNTDIIFSDIWSHKANYYRKITRPIDDLSEALASFFLKEKVFYQDNEVGNFVDNYLKWCKSA